MKNKLFAKIVAGLLAVLMVIGLLPLIASAATDDPSLDNLYLNKTAVLQSDGTWTITLEAYATGSVKEEVTKQVTPTDIILVLDQSGSMDDEDNMIKVAGGYALAGAVTNNTLLTGSTTYYYYDNNDKTYYPVTTTKQVSDQGDTQASNWYKYTVVDGVEVLGDLVCTDSASADVVGTFWTIGDSTVYFTSGYGYLKSDYKLFASTGNFINGYGYQQVDSSGNAVEGGVTVANSYDSRADAYAALQTQLGTGYQYDSEARYGFQDNYYAIAYVPVKLVDNNTYYYTYTYTDGDGQVWTIGHSAEFTVANDTVTSANYNTALGNLYTAQADTEVVRLEALKSSATTFIKEIYAAAQTHHVNHRIAVVGFASTTTDDGDDDYNDYSENAYENTELFVGATQYNYAELTSTHYQSAFQNLYSTENPGYNNLIASVNALAGKGGTFPNHGFEIARDIFRYSSDNEEDYTNRKRVIVFMTDGTPGRNGYHEPTATATVNLANTLRSSETVDEKTYNYGATVYTVAVLDAAPSGTNAEKEIAFLNDTASGDYVLATNGIDLTNFFHTVTGSVTSTTADVELTSNAFLVDRVSEYFNLPAGITQDTLKTYVNIQRAKHNGNHEFGTPEDVAFTVDADAAETEEEAGPHIWLTYSSDGTTPHGITVHNWDFTSQGTNGNLVTTDANGNATGYKLIVTIKGITAKDSAAIDGYVNTNNENSGIWDSVLDDAGNATSQYGMLKAFPMPIANLVNHTYVLDYGKTAVLHPSNNIRNAIHLDSAKDGVFSGFTTADTALNTNDENAAVVYGDASISNARVSYTPKTTNWNGTETFYVFWHYDVSSGTNPGIGDPVTGNGWSKVNVIPANNIYYEDTFVSTTESDGSGADNTTEGTVGIVYSGDWFTVTDASPDTEVDTTTNTPGDGVNDNVEHPENLESQDNANHGWEDSLADDDKYSDGSAHGAEFAKDENGRATAKASFTFTGTGMDIYSRTNSTTGTVDIKVEPDEATREKGARTKYFLVDNLAASGDYYQIPVVSYSGIHGTYTVTITVTGGADFEEYGNRKMFYLDGIRIYNPLSNEQENDPIVGEGYGTEVDAVFTEIRDKLLDAGSFNEQNPSPAGAVFIDQINADDVTASNPEGTTPEETTPEETTPEETTPEETTPEETTPEGTPVGTPTTTTVIGDYQTYGPKNEVYLSKGQSIVFKVSGTANTVYYVGLKAPSGTATTALVSNGNENASVTVDHSTDMYYKVVPTVGTDGYSYVQITNDDTGLLSITKLKMTYTDDEAPVAQTASVLQAISADEALTFAARFAEMPVAPYSLTEGNADAPEAETPDVEITVPVQPSLEEQLREKIAKLVAELFGSVSSWFNT